MKNNQNGITLVALVITIIILLILAGISIATLTGSGLFENAKLAKEKSDVAREKEEGILADYENKIEALSSSRTEASSGYSTTKLWEFDVNATDVNNGLQTGTITLSDSIQNYDEVVVTGQYYASATSYDQASNIRILKANYNIAESVNSSNNNHLIGFVGGTSTRRIMFGFTSNNQITIGGISNARLVNVYGIKY